MSKDVLKQIGLKPIEVKDNITPYITIVIVGDCNDADYVTTENKLELGGKYKDEIVQNLTQLVTLLKKNWHKLFKRHAVSDRDDVELEEIFSNDYFELPFDGNEHCHTIASVRFFYTDEHGAITNLELI